MIQPAEISDHFIDIENLFRAKNPRLLRLLPKFVFQYLRRVIHESQVNNIIYKHRDKSGLKFVEAIIHEFGFSIEVALPYLTHENHPEYDRNKVYPGEESSYVTVLSKLITPGGKVHHSCQSSPWRAGWNCPDADYRKSQAGRCIPGK